MKEISPRNGDKTNLQRRRLLRAVAVGAVFLMQGTMLLQEKSGTPTLTSDAPVPTVIPTGEYQNPFEPTAESTVQGRRSRWKWD